MRFLSLFSGIGGMDMGLERAGWTCVGQCEIDPYCRRVLAKHWPHVKQHDDVCTLDPKDFPPFDAIVGGFPCQDVSNAGLRAGISASRSGLYRELLRCLRVAGCELAVLENVAALLGRGMGTVLGDLAKIGYDAEWHCIPACAIGSPHIRDRVFILAHSENAHVSQVFKTDTELRKEWPKRQFRGADGMYQGDQRWAPEPGVVRVVDGVPPKVDRLRGIGNAVVPQVAELIGRSILQAKAVPSAPVD